MLWRLWQQHRADRAEARRLRTYLERHDAHRALCEVIVDARRRADIRWRLDRALASQREASMDRGRHALASDAGIRRS